MKQHTIKKTFSISGIGLHTGKEVELKVQAAPENHGYQFRRIDLKGQPSMKADVSLVSSTARGTTLQSGEMFVHTVEHILSALAGLQIDNVLIDLDGPEIPILDGSAAQWVQLLQKAGREEQKAARTYFEVTRPIFYKNETNDSELIALPYDGFQLTSLIDFGSPVLGQQYAELSNLDDYAEQIAPSRTFVFLKDVEQLANQNLIKGGDLDNAIVIADELMEQCLLDNLMEKLGKPKIKLKKVGILNEGDLRFKNEPARHKLLDVLGDLALLGKPIKGKIFAKKPGHKVNTDFAKILKQEYLKQRKLKGKPNYNPNKLPLMNTVQVAEWLPHRYPLLLVDKIIELSENHVVGVKNITFNESIFQGHFPGNPVFPGVLQVEALAQTGGILAMSKQEDPGNWDTYFLKIENTKFKQMVFPGDTLLLKMELIAPIRRGIVQMHGIAYVGDKMVCEGDLTAQIVKRK